MPMFCMIGCAGSDLPATTPDPNLDVYVTYANHWSRFAGMVQQGLQRTRQADRLLRMLREDEEQQSRHEIRAAVQEPQGSHPSQLMRLTKHVVCQRRPPLRICH